MFANFEKHNTKVDLESKNAQQDLEDRYFVDVSKKITRLYLLALSAIALLSIGGQILVQTSLSNQLTDSRVINVAGRQRMLSQRICKSALLLSDKLAGKDKGSYAAELEEALELWEKCHNGLKTGNLVFLQTPVKNSDTIRYMLEKLEPIFSIMLKNAKAIQIINKQNSPFIKDSINQKVVILLQQEKSFLKAMDAIVFQYQIEATDRVNKSRHTEFLLLICTLLILVLEGLFVFKPAVKQIKETIEKLVNSEKRALQFNKELIIANKSLEETRKALIEATEEKHLREMNKQKIRSAYLIEGQEEERKRIARDIHDGLGQMLTALKFGVEKLAHSNGQNQELAEIRTLLTQTIAETRTISFNLMPTVLSDFGIASALKLLTAQASSHSEVTVTFTSNIDALRLPKNIEVGLYRIAQEALNNAIKYANAKEINIDLSLQKRLIHLTITDNGQGFSYKENHTTPGKGKGNGISNMKERAFIINGEFKLITRPGKGTLIQIKVPH